MRRRSKPRVVWLPPDPYNRLGFPDSAISDNTQPSIGHESLHLIGPFAAGTQFGIAVPVVADGGNADQAIIGLHTGIGAAPTQTLSDLFNSGYRLRRICGHIFATIAQQDVQAGGLEGSIFLTCGFQVMKVDTTGNPVNVAAANPDTVENQENPWIWRRTWALSNFKSTDNQPLFATTNLGLSVREGTFVDQKTARIIGPDDRLFLCMTATPLVDQGAGVDTFVSFYWDLRFLASLKNNVGNRRNSSR